MSWRRAVPYCCVLVGAFVAALWPAVGRAEIDIIAQFNQSSPDGNGNLATFAQPSLSDSGDVAFLSLLLGTENDELDNIALVRGNTSGLSIVARKGITTLDGEVAENFVNNWPSINGPGVVSHSADRLSEPNEFVAFLGTVGPLQTYLDTDSPSPSEMNALVSHSVPVINNAGTAAYRAFYTGQNSEVGIYSRAPDGMVTTHLLQGVPAPNGGTILSISASLPTLNEAGQIALMASVDDGLFTRKSVMRLDGTTVNELVRDGDSLDDGVTEIGNILSNAAPLNDLGQTAFVATYTQPAASLRQGVFFADTEGVSLVAPGLLPGSATVATTLRMIGLNNAGTAAFAAEFATGGDPVGGIYLADSGGPTLIAIEDTATPVAGKFFRRFLNESISLNEDGQVAFVAELSNSPDGGFAGRALFLYDPAGGLQKILGTGDALAGSTVASIGLAGAAVSMTPVTDGTQSPDPSFSGLNNSNQIAFNFALTNTLSGIALWTGTSLPLPGDYNGNGKVDAGDYTEWRNHLGQTFTLTNENATAMTPGVVDAEDYDFWKSHFGDVAGGGSGSAPGDSPGAKYAVPEPAAAFLFALGLLSAPVLLCRRRISLDS